MLAAWRAVYMWRKRTILPIIDAQIAELEIILVPLLTRALPLFDPEAGPSKANDDFRELRDSWGFPRKRYRGRGPTISRYGLGFDVAARELLGVTECSVGEILHQLALLLDEYERLRGRGCRYGLLSRGVHTNMVASVTGTQLARDLAQGAADVCAQSLVRAAEKELAVAVHKESADFLRLLHRHLAETGAPDVRFRDLLLEGSLREGDIEALDILMGYPYGAIGWFKPFDVPEMPCWRVLSAMALGILKNDQDDDLWEGLIVLELEAFAA
jgi:hypothetical protein